MAKIDDYLREFGIEATPKKPAKKRAKNPAKRIGTAKPNRPSQITGKPPTKRLKARRVSNTKKGYFPNPTNKARVFAWHTGDWYPIVSGLSDSAAIEAVKRLRDVFPTHGFLAAR